MFNRRMLQGVDGEMNGPGKNAKAGGRRGRWNADGRLKWASRWQMEGRQAVQVGTRIDILGQDEFNGAAARASTRTLVS